MQYINKTSSCSNSNNSSNSNNNRSSNNHSFNNKHNNKHHHHSSFHIYNSNYNFLNQILYNSSSSLIINNLHPYTFSINHHHNNNSHLCPKDTNQSSKPQMATGVMPYSPPTTTQLRVAPSIATVVVGNTYC